MKRQEELKLKQAEDEERRLLEVRAYYLLISMVRICQCFRWVACWELYTFFFLPF